MKKVIIISVLLFSVFIGSCEKDSTTNLADTVWKSTDVFDPTYEEYILLKFKDTTFEIWYKDYDDPLYKDAEGLYTVKGKNITINLGKDDMKGVIDKNKIIFTEDRQVLTFTKQ